MKRSGWVGMNRLLSVVSDSVVLMALVLNVEYFLLAAPVVVENELGNLSA